MKKYFNQWKIYFNSMSHERINLFLILVFLFVSLLNDDIVFARQRAMETNFFNWTLSVLLMFNVFLNFIRMNFNKENFRFSKTLPCSKKIYTKYVWISFEFFNSIYLLVGLIFWIICSQKGIVSDYSPFIFFADCILYFLFSIGFPFFAIQSSTEINNKKKKFSFSSIFKFGWILYIAILIFCPLLSFAAKHVVENEITFFTVNPVYIVVCALIVVLSWAVNRLIFNKIYKLL